MSEKQLSRPMWICPQCGRPFANAHQSHACSRHTLAEHLEGKPAAIIALYRQLEAVIQSMGPVIVVPEKTRIAFQVRMSFAALMLKQRWIDGHVVLARRLESPRFRRIESISPRNHVHAFRLSSPEEIDAELTAWIAEAYLVGEQRHLRSSMEDPPREPSGQSQVSPPFHSACLVLSWQAMFPKCWDEPFYMNATVQGLCRNTVFPTRLLSP